MTFLRRLFSVGAKPSRDDLVRELVSIGRSTLSAEGAYFRPEGEGVGPNKTWDRRTREIGELLHSLGGLHLMRGAHGEVQQKLGQRVAHDLSAQWHGVGWDGPEGNLAKAQAKLAMASVGLAELDSETRLKLEGTWQH